MNRPRISFKEKKLTLSPDPIIAKQGEEIEIELFADLTESGYSIGELLKYRNLKWKIHFKNGNPFHSEQSKSFEFNTHNTIGVPLHSNIVSLGKTENKGEYKFDIVVSKDSNRGNDSKPSEIDEEEILEEVDPIIIVI